MVEKFRGRITSLVPTPHIAFGNSRGGGQPEALPYTHVHKYNVWMFFVSRRARS